MQIAVDKQQRQIGGQVDVDRAAFEVLLHLRERDADELFEHLPLAIEEDGAGVEACHVEQVVDEARQALRFVGERFQQRPRLGRGRFVEAGGRAGDGCQRRAQVVRDRAEQRIAELLGFDLHLGLVGFEQRLIALDGKGDEARAGFERATFFGIEEAVRIARAARRGRRSCAASRPSGRRRRWRWGACRCRGRRDGHCRQPSGRPKR